MRRSAEKKPNELHEHSAQKSVELSSTHSNHMVKPVFVKQVSCGNEHTLVVDDEGRLYCAGNNSKGQLGVSERLSKNKHYIIPEKFNG